MDLMPQRSATQGVNGWIVMKHYYLRFWYRRYFVILDQELSCSSGPGGRLHFKIDLPAATVLGQQHQMYIVIQTPPGTRGVKLSFDNRFAFCSWLAALRFASSHKMKDRYEFRSLLGRGGFGKVYKALDKTTDETCAVKVVEKSPDSQNGELHFWRELNCMRLVSHPNIVKALSIYDTPWCMNLVLEYMPGGSLHRVFSRYGPFSETQTKGIIKEILEGTAYLHSKYIVHRDLKLENILCSAPDFPFTVKIADFGLANFLSSFNPNGDFRSYVGSPYYIAPEMLKGDPYGPLVDSWSIGSMMYVLLTKTYPFCGNSMTQTLEQVIVGNVSFPGPLWARVSEDAKNFLRRLLAVDPNERLSPRQALLHPWIRSGDLPPNLQRNRTFLGQVRLRDERGQEFVLGEQI